MKVVSQTFKDNIKTIGKELDVKLSYEVNGVSTLLDAEDINSVSFSYNGELFKSIMKQLVIDVNQEIPSNAIINCQFGIKVADDNVSDYRDNYEYVDFGDFLIKDGQKKEDTLSYSYTCYDYMLNSMIPYDGVDLRQFVQTLDATYQEGIEYYKLVDDEYKLLEEGTDYEVGDAITGTIYVIESISITLRDYISRIASHMGLTFYNGSDTFANYDKVLTQDLYVDSEGASIGYTFRDVLDDIAEATGTTIITDGTALKMIEPTTTNEELDEESCKNINVNFGKKYGLVNKLSLTRSADSDVIYRNDETSIVQNGETELSFSDNQLLSQDDREEWIDAIFNKVKGTEYYITDFSSTGITYLEPLDKYDITIDGTTYNCLMLADEINITQGLEENIHCDELTGTKTDYATSSTTDKMALQTKLIVDKQLGQIVGEVASQTDISNLQEQIDANGNAITSLGTRVTQAEENVQISVSKLDEVLDDNGNVTSVKNSLVQIDSDGILVQTNTSQIKTQMTNDAFKILDTTGELAVFNNDGAYLDNLEVEHYFIAGYHRVEKMEGQNRTGWFYIGG